MSRIRLHSATIRAVAAGSAVAIVAQLVGAAEDAIVCARNGVHERRVVANYGAGKIESRDDRDLTAMWFEIADRAQALSRQFRHS